MAPYSSSRGSGSSSEIPSDLVGSLGCKSPYDALLALANESELLAAKLAEELAQSLSNRKEDVSHTSHSKGKVSPSKRRSQKQQQHQQKTADGDDDDDEDVDIRRFPIPLPQSLKDAPRPSSHNRSASSGAGATPSRTLFHSHPHHHLTTATLASESILSSLTKIASGGSEASSEMRQLEHERQALDAEALDIEHALAIREGCIRGGDSLMGRRYADAARAVADVNAILEGKPATGSSSSGYYTTKATEHALQLAGPDALASHAKTVDVLQRAISEKYELAVHNSDVASLSELTPLLGLLNMAEMGVKYYLQFSQSVLCSQMNFDHVATTTTTTTSPLSDNASLPSEETMADMPREEGMSRAAMRRRAEQQRQAQLQKQQQAALQSVPMKLAKIYNAAVTHLRHHLPMVAYSLGVADGDAALVQLVHVEVEKRVVDILREYMVEKELGRTVRRAEVVASKLEDRYTSSSSGGGGGGKVAEEGLFGMDENNIANVIMGLGVVSSGSGSGDMTMDSILSKRSAAQRNDCGFAIEVGNLSDVDAALEEWALILQHTESYERFIRHAVEEVIKARKLRFEQKCEEKRRWKEMEKLRSRDSYRVNDTSSMMLASPRDKTSKDINAEEKIDDEVEAKIEVLPPHTALNEVAAEIGGYYVSLERCLLLAGMQRAFIQANFPDDSSYTPAIVAMVGNAAVSNMHYATTGGAGSRALQTNLVEECMFAARRSTLRAFATGHTGTASAAANICVDVLGRVLLDVLSRRAELSASLLKPGEGLLDGQSGLGQAALSFAKTTAGKGLRGVQGAAARAGAKVGDINEETAESMKQRALVGVARAVANYNDLEVVVEYTKKLEENFLREIDAGYPRGHDTEQLRMCVKGLAGVVESFIHASNQSMEELISTLWPQVRQLVNDAVGQESSSTIAASNFLGSPVLTGGATTSIKAALDYNLDDEAFQLSQISEGYMGRLCTSLDEFLDPLRIHLVPKLSDNFVIGILAAVAKRLEGAIRKSKFTPLGAINLDSDIRYLMNFAKDQVDSAELKSNVALCKVCRPISRLNQISLLMNVDDLEDALDLISVSKRKDNWDLKLDDVKILLCLRVDFEGSKVNELLQINEVG